MGIKRNRAVVPSALIPILSTLGEENTGDLDSIKIAGVASDIWLRQTAS